MSDNRPLEPDFKKAGYNSLVASINYEYCRTKGYDFLYYRPYLNDSNEGKINLLNCKNPVTGALRHASWSKLLCTSHALEFQYDYVVYIDSDCIFKDFNQSIEDFIKEYSHKDIIFLNNKPWGTGPCAGFYICKVNEKAKMFLEEWYAVNIPERDINHEWEQAALYKIYMNYNIGIIDSWMFHEKDVQFLRHVGHTENMNRIPYFSSFIRSKNIQYEETIKKIWSLAYDTARDYIPLDIKC